MSLIEIILIIYLPFFIQSLKDFHLNYFFISILFAARFTVCFTLIFLLFCAQETNFEFNIKEMQQFFFRKVSNTCLLIYSIKWEILWNMLQEAQVWKIHYLCSNKWFNYFGETYDLGTSPINVCGFSIFLLIDW